MCRFFCLWFVGHCIGRAVVRFQSWVVGAATRLSLLAFDVCLFFLATFLVALSSVRARLPVRMCAVILVGCLTTAFLLFLVSFASSFVRPDLVSAGLLRSSFVWLLSGRRLAAAPQLWVLLPSLDDFKFLVFLGVAIGRTASLPTALILVLFVSLFICKIICSLAYFILLSALFF